jgi:hypothetical protein
MINKFYTRTFEVWRNEYTTAESGFSSSEESKQGEFKGHLQQISPNETESRGMNFSKSFTIWCPPNTDVVVGDRLKNDALWFIVQSLQDNNFVGSNRHLQVFVELDYNGS